MNNYESVFILKSALDKEAEEKLVDDIKQVVTKNKGSIAQMQSWGKRKLAYPIKKQTEGIYYLLEFQLEAARMAKVENTYKLNDSIIRTLIVRK